MYKFFISSIFFIWITQVSTLFGSGINDSPLPSIYDDLIHSIDTSGFKGKKQGGGSSGGGDGYRGGNGGPGGKIKVSLSYPPSSPNQFFVEGTQCKASDPDWGTSNYKDLFDADYETITTQVTENINLVQISQTPNPFSQRV